MLILHSCGLKSFTQNQRYCSHKITLPNCYCPIFPFLSSWGCININEMLKEKGEKKEERKSSWANNNYSVIIQRKIMALLHVWNFPLYFTPAFAKLCANDGSPYIHMNVLCEVEMFSLPGNYFLSQWLSILFLSCVLFLPMPCRWQEIPLSFKFQPCLSGTKNSFHDPLEGTSTEIPGLQKNNPRNPDLIALLFLLRLENGSTTQLNSINFSSLHHEVVILAQKSFGLFSVYMAIFLLSSKFPITWKIQSEAAKATGVKRKLQVVLDFLDEEP